MKARSVLFVLCALLAGLSAFARSGTVAVSSTNYLASVAQSLTVTFDNHAHETNGLWVAWDDADCGASTNGWANVAFVRAVLPGLDRLEYVLPTGWGETGKKALRFFLSEVPGDIDCTLDYIESTGTQYLALPNHKLTDKSVVEMDCLLTEVTGTHPLFCSRKGTSRNQFTVFALSNSGNPRWRFDYYYTGSKTDPEKKQVPTAGIRYLIKASGNGLSVNNTLAQACPSTETSFVADGALTVLAHHGGDVTKPSGRSKATLYSFSVADATNTASGVTSDILLVPAVKAGVAGACDLVSGQFFGSAGSGTFTAGARQESATPFFAATEAVGPMPDAEGLVFKTDFEMTDATVHADGTAGVKEGDGLVTLTGANDFGGSFTVNGGALAADFGQGLGASDNLKLMSGTFSPPSGSVTAELGTGAGQISLAGGAVGFSAVSGDLNVNLGGAGADVTLGAAEPTKASALVLNDARGVHTLTLANKIIAPAASEIANDAGRAVLTGGAEIGGALTKTGLGTLEVRGATVTVDAGAGGATVLNGKLELTEGAKYLTTNNFSIGAGTIAGSEAQLIVSNATVDLGLGACLYLQAATKSDDFTRLFVYGDSYIRAQRIFVSRGELNMFGGTVTTDPTDHGLTMGENTEACRLWGGLLEVRDVRVNGKYAAFEWRGGGVRATRSRESFFDNLASKVRVGKVGGVFDTPEGIRLSITNVIDKVYGESADAYSRATAMTAKAFRKEGQGTLGLSGQNKYLCATDVHEGTLKLWTANAVPTGRLLRLTGGTFWLNGFDQTVANLAGFGAVRGPGTLTVTGEVVPRGLDGTGELALNDGVKLVGKVVFPVKEDGTLDGSLTSTGTLDLTDIDLVVENLENLPPEGKLVLARANAFSGTFKRVSELPNGWRLSVGAKRVALTTRGLALLIK